jgi:peptide/nickel transport system substrate-binding protein
MQSEQWAQVDPQRMYTAEDLAFFSATTMRTLTAYTFSADPKLGTTLTPDLATDLGTPTDGGRTWSFTLRDGVSWQDGSPITCEDVKYGASRAFATDIINQGPTYAIVYLDIPTENDGSSAYKGPYTKIGQDLYDKAVVCDGATITFHLKRPVADFNYTVTLGFAPVRASDDTGETYGTVAPFTISSGPYKVDSYTTGKGGRYVLSRNANWKPESDPYRHAYPDRWEIDFTIDLDVLATRMTTPIGNDETAVMYDALPPDDVPAMFADAETPRPEFAGRAVAAFDPYVRYYWIDVDRVPNVKIRQAMAVALDRAAIRDIYGGASFGSFADGVIKPTLGADYAPTGFWETYFGHPIPDTGDAALAKQLIQQSGEVAPVLAFSAPDTPTQRRVFDVVAASLGRAGFTVEFKPPCPAGYYCSIVFTQHPGDFGTGGWGADWPSASTVIPPLFTEAGGWDLSRLDDPAVDAAIADAMATVDRAAQAEKWQALNRRAVENAWVIPTFFSRTYRIAGSKVGPIYQWPAYSSWPYGEMFVTR